MASSSSAAEDPGSLTPATSNSAPQDSSSPNDDIWASASPSQSNSPSSRPARGDEELLSDEPLIRRQHTTAGYREGVSLGKAQTMQDGFDEGYPLGIQTGLRVGFLRGVLEGIECSKKLSSVENDRVMIGNLLDSLQEDLAIAKFLEGVEDTLVDQAKSMGTDPGQFTSNPVVATESLLDSSRSHKAISPNEETVPKSASLSSTLFAKAAMEKLSSFEAIINKLLMDMPLENSPGPGG